MVTDTVKMNAEKLKQLQANVRIGGKGTVRRKKKVVHRTATTDDKKLQSSLKKLSGKAFQPLKNHSPEAPISGCGVHMHTSGFSSQSDPVIIFVPAKLILILFFLCSQQHPRH
jgi:hypothetical protein